MVVRFEAQGCVKDSPFKILLDSQSLAWNEQRKRERGDKPRSLYASDYGQCPRKVLFSFFPDIFPVELSDARLMRVFHNGEDVHRRLQTYLSQSGIPFLEEVDVPRDDLDVHGRCDGLAMLHDVFYVLEFKSINLPFVSEPKEEHLGQILWYMLMWEDRRLSLRSSYGLADGEVPDVGVAPYADLDVVDRMLLSSRGPVQGEIIYESKANQRLFHYQVGVQHPAVERVRSWFAAMRSSVDSGVVPAVTYHSSRYPCRWSDQQCPYYAVCHEGGLLRIGGALRRAC